VLLACAPKASSLSDPDAPAQAQPAEGTPAVSGSSDPRVSRSAGEAGGVVVLFPRIIPAEAFDSTRMIAGLVQQRAQELVERTLAGRPIDVRPEPERTCPKAGCAAVALGVLIVRQGDGCAVVGFVMPPGTSDPTTLVPWTGDLTLKQTTIPFRAYPESEVVVSDYGPCDDLPGSLGEHEAEVAAALTAAAGG
jgi:hypothetical protein